MPQLVARTLEVAGNHALRERMMQAAIARAPRFSRHVFERRATALLEPLLRKPSPR